MALPSIFCPQCDALILDAEACSNCHWRRPVLSDEVGKPAWAVALETRLPSQESYPVAGNHHVYFTTEKAQIIAVDILEAQSDKAIKWRYQVDSKYRCHGAAVWQDFVLLGNEFSGGFPTPPGEFLMVNAQDGQEFWRHAVEGASLAVPVVNGNTAYAAVNSGWIYAIDLQERQELWRKKVEANWSWAPLAPLVTPTGLLILAGRSDTLVAFEVESGNIAWTFLGGGWFPHTPVWFDGVVYARCWDQHIYALDGATGQEIWRYKAPREYSSDMCVTDKYVYIGVKDYQGGAAEGSRAYALYTLDRHSGERVTRYEIPGHIFGRPAAAESAVFFATDDKSSTISSQGTLYALDAQGQNPLWEPCVVEQRFQSDLLLLGDWIIAATRQGAVYGIPWMSEQALGEPPQTYAAQGQWEKAALAYALQGNYTQAAEIYAGQLERPLHAGRLYLQAGEPDRVISLLGRSQNEAERALAMQAAQSLPNEAAQARALSDMGEYLAAADIFIQLGDLEKAGDCYLEAQDWEQALDAYAKAKAWEKWEKVTRERELWQDLVDRYVSVGQFAQAAEIQVGRGYFLEAASYFDQADMPAKALLTYHAVGQDKLTPEIEQRMLELAEITGEFEIAYNIYKRSGQLEKAAELAETTGHVSHALELYKEIGEFRKAAEILEKQSRYGEAADMYERARRWGKAAENLEKQVEQEIERAGGLRDLQDTAQLESWLDKAIRFYEEEADYAGEITRQELYAGADRCQVSLMRVRREPLLRLNLQADRMVYNQGNTIHYEVENVGWGTARDVTLTISGSNLRERGQYNLGSLGRRQKAEGVATVVPTLVGDILVQVELQGQSKGGQVHHAQTAAFPVVPAATMGGAGVSLNAQVGYGAERLRSTEFPVVDRGSLWEPGTAGSSTGGTEAPVSPEKLRQDRINALRVQLSKQYNVLNVLEVQAADYPAGQAPVDLQVKINSTQNKIEEIEDQLAELEGE